MIELYAHEKMDFFDKKDDPFQNYLITNFGRVYSLKSNQWVKPLLNSRGYPRIDVNHYINKIRVYRKQVFIHIEVVKVFGDCLGHKFDKSQKNIDIIEIDHLDKNPLNSSYKNLEIVTNKENMRRRFLSDEERRKFIETRYAQEINVEDIF